MKKNMYKNNTIHNSEQLCEFRMMGSDKVVIETILEGITDPRFRGLKVDDLFIMNSTLLDTLSDVLDSHTRKNFAKINIKGPKSSSIDINIDDYIDKVWNVIGNESLLHDDYKNQGYLVYRKKEIKPNNGESKSGKGPIITLYDNKQCPMLYISGDSTYEVIRLKDKKEYLNTLNKIANEINKDLAKFSKEEIEEISPGIYDIIYNDLLNTMYFHTRDITFSEIKDTKDTKIDEFENLMKSNMENIGYRKYLLYGPPGTGKTTTAANVINNLSKNKDIITIYSTVNVDLGIMKKVVETLQHDVIWVIDDGEIWIRNQEEADMLNFLHGNLSPVPQKSFSIIITTNHPAEISGRVLSRPGRINYFIEIGLLTKSQANKLTKKIYNKADAEALCKSEIFHGTTPDLINEMANHIATERKIFPNANIDPVNYVKSYLEVLDKFQADYDNEDFKITSSAVKARTKKN